MNDQYVSKPKHIRAWQFRAGPLPFEKAPDWVMAALSNDILVLQAVKTKGSEIDSVKVRLPITRMKSLFTVRDKTWIIRHADGAIDISAPEYFEKTWEPER